MTEDTLNQSNDLPKIWYSRILNSIEIMTQIDYELIQNNRQSRINHQAAYFNWETCSGNEGPQKLILPKGGRIKKSIRDAFKILNGLLIVSPAFKQVLDEFDIGKNRLFEVPLFLADGETPSEYPPHYLLHIQETKPTLIPEESRNIRRPIPPGKVEPNPGARWKETYDPDELAVHASAADGADLWADPIMQKRLFFSDRLKRAIEEESIVSEGLDFNLARSFEGFDSSI